MRRRSARRARSFRRSSLRRNAPKSPTEPEYSTCACCRLLPLLLTSLVRAMNSSFASAIVALLSYSVGALMCCTCLICCLPHVLVFSYVVYNTELLTLLLHILYEYIYTVQ